MSNNNLGILLTPQQIVDGNHADKWIVLVYHEQSQVIPVCTLGEAHNLYVFDSDQDAYIAGDSSFAERSLYIPVAFRVADVLDFITAKADGSMIDDDWWHKREGYELQSDGTWRRQPAVDDQ